MGTAVRLTVAVLRRAVQLVIVLLVVSFLTFLLLKALPGSPDKLIIPNNTNPELRAKVRHDLRLDRPFFDQYAHWLDGVVHGDLGHTYLPSTEVSTRISDSVAPTLQLMLYAQILALVIAVPLGVITAYKQGTWFDKISNTSAFGLLALPGFVIGLLLIYWLAVKNHTFPALGYTPFGQDIGEHFRSMALPTISLALGQIAIYMRLLRSDMIATLQDDYITMAKSKGIPPRRVLWRHALRPSSLTLLTVAGLNVGLLIGGSVVIEVLFGLPGLGFLINFGITAREYVLVQGCVLVIAVAYVLVNALVDALYRVLDPRLRHTTANA